ncbi:Sodium/hydrogen exchanger 7 [Auxenochlorella protothecoides]|uniref:Sodium/hydrogen exchanger 7 n=1 Tax=Auxenochlorella protothecoides TaxID=3075 RepID=A0A087SD92_AUXPR|nr:Sodium/hydrogen exchanger 7 [Auxenochlorella protothecoides]KFM23696.1 Sodium/hydrogen exchanger 7 [Auxenochlorella protothecoides]
MNSTQFNEELAHALHSIWTPETYRSFYDEAYCLTNNVTLKSRSNAEESFNYCSVPLEDQDSILFLALAVLFTAGLSGKLALTGVLVAGGVLGVVNYYVNLGHLGNAVSIWLGIQPPDLFLYVFLPPLLADAALRIRFSLFRKVALNIGILAYAMVILNVLVLTPFVLHALGFAGRGMDWAHGALFAAMLAPTDAVSVSALLKAANGPELLVVLMEGEALFNDASAITLYSIFAEVLEEYQNQPLPPATALLGHIVVKILKLTSIGLAIGLAFGYFTGWLMRLLRWRGIPVPLDATVILAIAYLSFYVGQGPAQSSGVIAVAVFGLWGAATSLWGRFALEEEEKVWFAVWDSVSAVANGVVFFWAGVASLNFLVRSSDYLTSPGWVYGSIPIIFLFMFLFRFVTILIFNPLVLKGGTWLNLGQAVFVMAGGLRGALSLILVADLIITSNFHSSAVVASENATIVVWTSAFVLLTLLVNAPLLGPIMTWSGIKKMSAARKQLRLHGLSLLQKFTDNKIAALRTDHSFISQGANWEQVAEMTSHLAAMTSFEKASGGTSTSLPAWEAAMQTHGSLAKREHGAPARAALGSDEASQRGQLLTGLQRYFQRQRAAGLLSSQGLDVLILACEVAEHHVDLHPSDPLTLWSLVDQDVSGGWGTRAQAVILRKLLVLPQRLPRAGQRCAAFVFLPFTALLQASLSRQMVTACEAALEMSQGLLRELRGIFLEAEEAELGGAVDGAIRRLDATDHTRTQGAIWSSADSAAAPALHVVASGVVTATIAHAGGWEAEAHQGVGFVYGALDLIMGGATSPWRRSVAPHVNALGQGPQVYTFPAASLAALPPACQDDLLIQAAAEVLEGTEKDLNRDTSTVILWFKGGASLPGPGLPRLQSMVQHEIQMHLSPGESHVLRLEPGAEWAQASHAVLLRGSLVPQAQAEATCVPPAVLPFLPALRPRKDAAPQPQRWRAGPEGAVLVHLG